MKGRLCSVPENPVKDTVCDVKLRGETKFNVLCVAPVSTRKCVSLPSSVADSMGSAVPMLGCGSPGACH